MLYLYLISRDTLPGYWVLRRMFRLFPPRLKSPTLPLKTSGRVPERPGSSLLKWLTSFRLSLLVRIPALLATTWSGKDYEGA